VLEKHQPGREASWAAGGMLAYCEAGPNPLFRQLAYASASMYPAFVEGLQERSGVDVDFRRAGTIRFFDAAEAAIPDAIQDVIKDAKPLSIGELRALEPSIGYSSSAALLAEDWVDPRQLLEALLKTALNLGVHVASGADVTHLQIEDGKAVAAVTTKTRYAAKVFVNCAGAWAGNWSPIRVPVRPIKGQMLALLSAGDSIIQHVVRGNGVYVIPRADGRIVVGSTVEDVGFDKRVDSQTIQRMHQAAAILIPQLGEARIHEDWAGLRPCSPDKLPIMGETSLEGYFVSTGHYRDGILLAPVSAKLMAQIVSGFESEMDIEAFSPARF
jgi:glycine oxidase